MACELCLNKAVILKRSEREGAMVPVIPEPSADPGYLWGHRMYRGSNILSRLQIAAPPGEPRDALLFSN